MSKQLTVRLPDELVEFVDSRVREGSATSRASVISAALDRERRQQIAQRDAAILARTTELDDFDALAAHAAGTELADLD